MSEPDTAPAVRLLDGFVVLDYGHPVTLVKLTPDDAVKFSQTMAEAGLVGIARASDVDSDDPKVLIDKLAMRVRTECARFLAECHKADIDERALVLSSLAGTLTAFLAMSYNGENEETRRDVTEKLVELIRNGTESKAAQLQQKETKHENRPDRD